MSFQNSQLFVDVLTSCNRIYRRNACRKRIKCARIASSELVYSPKSRHSARSNSLVGNHVSRGSTIVWARTDLFDYAIQTNTASRSTDYISCDCNVFRRADEAPSSMRKSNLIAAQIQEDKIICTFIVGKHAIPLSMRAASGTCETEI